MTHHLDLGGSKSWAVSAAYAYLNDRSTVREMNQDGTRQRQATKAEINQLESQVSDLNLEKDGQKFKLKNFSGLKSTADQRVNIWDAWETLNMLYKLKDIYTEVREPFYRLKLLSGSDRYICDKNKDLSSWGEFIGHPPYMTEELGEWNKRMRKLAEGEIRASVPKRQRVDKVASSSITSPSEEKAELSTTAQAVIDKISSNLTKALLEGDPRAQSALENLMNMFPNAPVNSSTEKPILIYPIKGENGKPLTIGNGQLETLHGFALEQYPTNQKGLIDAIMKALDDKILKEYSPGLQGIQKVSLGLAFIANRFTFKKRKRYRPRYNMPLVNVWLGPRFGNSKKNFEENRQIILDLLQKAFQEDSIDAGSRDSSGVSIDMEEVPNMDEWLNKISLENDTVMYITPEEDGGGCEDHRHKCMVMRKLGIYDNCLDIPTRTFKNCCGYNCLKFISDIRMRIPDFPNNYRLFCRIHQIDVHAKMPTTLLYHLAVNEYRMNVAIVYSHGSVLHGNAEKAEHIIVLHGEHYLIKSSPDEVGTKMDVRSGTSRGEYNNLSMFIDLETRSEIIFDEHCGDKVQMKDIECSSSKISQGWCKHCHTAAGSCPKCPKPYITGPQVPYLLCYETREQGGASNKGTLFSLDCVSEFLRYLLDEHANKRNYRIYAHNGGRFDFYFILNEIWSNDDWRKGLRRGEFYNIVWRGTKILAFSWFGHTFVDSLNFLTMKLDDVGKKFKLENRKMKDGVQGMNSTEILLAHPHLNPEKYMEWIQEDEERRSFIVDYCRRDCEVIAEAFMLCSKTYHEVVIACTGKRHGCKYPTLNRCYTLPGASQKLWLYALGDKVETLLHNKGIKNLCRMGVIGGISYVGYHGKHTYSIAHADIVSLYPFVMMHAPMPVGSPTFVKEYKPFKKEGSLGLYFVKNLDLGDKVISRRAGKHKTGLDWNAKFIESESELGTPITNVELDLIIDDGGSFEVNFGIIWYESSTDIFIHFEEVKKLKMQEDAKSSEERNVGLREMCKMTLNSLYGKMLESSSRENWSYSAEGIEEDCDVADDISVAESEDSRASSLSETSKKKHPVFGSIRDERDEVDRELLKSLDKLEPELRQSIFDIINLEKSKDNTKDYHGVTVKSKSTPFVSEYTALGLFILAFSKVTLFSYLDKIERSNIIAIETDSFWCKEELMKKIGKASNEIVIRNNANAVSNYRYWKKILDSRVGFGDEFGNLKMEEDDIEIGYFLGKKMYYTKTSERFINSPEGRIKSKNRLVKDKSGNLKEVPSVVRKCKGVFWNYGEMTKNENGDVVKMINSDILVEDFYQRLMEERSVTCNQNRFKANKDNFTIDVRPMTKTLKIKDGIELREYECVEDYEKIMRKSY